MYYGYLYPYVGVVICCYDDVCLLGIMCSLCCHDYRGKHKVGGHQCASLWGPRYGQVRVPQVSHGSDGLHEEDSCPLPRYLVPRPVCTPGQGRGSDGLRAEESHHEGVDPGGRGTGAGQRVCVSSMSLTRWVGRQKKCTPQLIINVLYLSKSNTHNYYI